MRNKFKKNLLRVIMVLIAALFLSGCGGSLLGVLGPSPESAMIKYLEEKYDEDVTCLKTFGTGGSYMVNGGTGGEFVSNKNPGFTFECSAYQNGIWSYKFYDDYQVNFYQEDVRSVMKETAKKYFDGEYYVVADPKNFDSDMTEFMDYEEYVKRKDMYYIIIYVFDMSDEEACDAMQKFVEDVEGQGYPYTFYLGRNIGFEKEEFMELIYDKEFSPWYKGVKWLYYKRLSVEGEAEIYIST